VPQVLGFHPEDSVVLMTFGNVENFHARVDLPDDEGDQRAVVDMLARVIAHHRVPRVALLLYTDDAWTAATFHDAVVPRLVRDGVDVIEVLRVTDERFHDAGDVDDPGTAYDLKAHRFTAEQVMRGKVVQPSREHLAASIRLVDAEDARAVADAVDRLSSQLAGILQLVRAQRVVRDLAEHARWLQRTIRRHLRQGTRPSAEDAGRILLLVSIGHVRDVAWAEMTHENSDDQVELWRDLVRRCPTELIPAATSLLAFAAWLSGQGALAWCALDRCHEVDSQYSLAGCIRDMLDGALPPSVWVPIDERDLRVFWPTEPDAS